MSKHLPPKKNKHEKEPEPSVLNVPLRERKSSRIKNELTELGWKNYVFIALSAILLAEALAVGGESRIGLGLFGAAFAAAAVQVIYHSCSFYPHSCRSASVQVHCILAAQAFHNLGKFCEVGSLACSNSSVADEENDLSVFCNSDGGSVRISVIYA